MFDLTQFVLKAHAHIFNGGPLPDGAQQKLMLNGKIKAVVQPPYSVIEQNPDKASKYALYAKAGHKVSWLVQDSPNGGRGHYIAAVVDGQPDRAIPQP